MAHHHSHCHHHHYHHYRHSNSGSWTEVIIWLIIIIGCIAFMVHRSIKYDNYWNNGYHTCGSAYTYHICDKCGEIDEIYCIPCGYKLDIPEGIKLK